MAKLNRSSRRTDTLCSVHAEGVAACDAHHTRAILQHPLSVDTPREVEGLAVGGSVVTARSPHRGTQARGATWAGLMAAERKVAGLERCAESLTVRRVELQHIGVANEDRFGVIATVRLSRSARGLVVSAPTAVISPFHGCEAPSDTAAIDTHIFTRRDEPGAVDTPPQMGGVRAFVGLVRAAVAFAAGVVAGLGLWRVSAREH